MRFVAGMVAGFLGLIIIIAFQGPSTLPSYLLRSRTPHAADDMKQHYGAMGVGRAHQRAAIMRDMDHHNSTMLLPPEDRGPRWIVITSINYPTPTVKALASMYPAWRVVVVGDVKTPKDWSWPNVIFLSIEDQDKLGYRIAKYIPLGHYARKNIGYLFAIANGATTIYETDDDGVLLSSDFAHSFFLEPGKQNVDVGMTEALVMNPYHIFGQPKVWPRGYPVDLLTEDDKYTLRRGAVVPSVQQALINGDGDSDAVFRLKDVVQGESLDINFLNRPPVAIPSHVYAPFNSRNTLFNYDAFWGTMLPVTTSSHVCDIWRAYFVQRLMFDMGESLVFTRPNFLHKPDTARYLDDFKDEEHLHQHALALITFLSSWTTSSATNIIEHEVVELSQAMADSGLWRSENADMAEAWIADLREAGYVFSSSEKMEETATSDAMAASPLVVAPETERSWELFEEEAAFSSLPPYVRQALSLRDLPLLKPGRIPFMQFTSHEGNADLSNFLYQITPTKDLVVWDMEGPGCIYRGWIYLNEETPSLTLRLDDEVVLTGGAEELFSSGAGGRLPDPFLRNFNQATGMDMAFPFCFTSSAQISLHYDFDFDIQSTSDCIFQQTQCKPAAYVNIAGERRVDVPISYMPTFDHSKSPSSAEWSEYMSHTNQWKAIVDTKGVETITFNPTIEPGSTVDVFRFEKEGAIKGIIITVPVQDWDKLHWEMTWDGASEPQVSVPFNRMYNSWNLEDIPLLGYHLGAYEDQGQVHAYVFYPMPFSVEAVGRIVNRGDAAATLSGTIAYNLIKPGELPEYSPGTTSGYYHAKWVYKPWAPCFNELLTLDNQAGHVVSHSWALHGRRLEWVENDPVVYIDDSRSPKLWYSGLEDEVGGAHGFHYYREHSGPMYGWHYHYFEGDGSRNRIHAYVNAFGDSHRFMKNYQYGIQGHNRDGERQLDYTFHWYASPRPMLALTDELDMADENSLASHSYYATSDALSVEVTSAVNGRWYYYVSGFQPESLNTHTHHDCPQAAQELVTRHGTVAKEGELVFTINIDPANDGVIIRRMLDLYYTPQRASVSVDGEYVGIWLNSDHGTEYAPQRFADNSDYLIPGKYTHGKHSIIVSLQITPRDPAHWTSSRKDYNIEQGFGWTAFHYWIYSITP